MTAVTLNVAGLVLAVVAGGFPGLAFGDPTIRGSSVQAASKAPRLNDTGFTTCIDTSTWQPTPCAGTGQDGEFGRDVKHPDPANGLAGFSFVKVCNNGKQAGEGGCRKGAVQGSGPHDWGCTKDLVTGLTWELMTSDGSIRDANRFFSNFGTNDPSDTGGLVAAMNAQALCGATDWRLPSVTELFTLANYNPSADLSKWIPDLAFGYDEFWTPESLHSNPDYAWYVDTSQATNAPVNYINQRSGNTVVTGARVVRGGGDLTHLVAKDAEVADTVNHLSWRRCVEGMTWQGPNCVGTPTLLFWSDALAYANAVAASTGVGWRLPNIKELQSIVVLSTKSPTIDHSLFPQTPATFTWSSTGGGEGLHNQHLFHVDFGSGIAEGGYMANELNFAIRLVRDTD
jgi:hypothetical protein